MCVCMCRKNVLQNEEALTPPTVPQGVLQTMNGKTSSSAVTSRYQTLKDPCANLLKICGPGRRGRQLGGG